MVDTNVLFSFFGKTGTRKLIYSLYDSGVDLYTPSFARRELEKLRDVIQKKAEIDDASFDLIATYLFMLVREVPFMVYAEYIHKASEITPDPDDVDFVALALKYGCKIWTLDKALLAAEQVPTVSTLELAKLFETRSR